MTDRSLPYRQSIRLKGYDYSKAGFYFITLCVQYRLHLFGKCLQLNDAGEMVERWYFEMQNKYPNIRCKKNATIGDMMDWFKTMTTNEYIRGVKNHGWQRFNGKLWQRNYWEHIIRDENELS